MSEFQNNNGEKTHELRLRLSGNFREGLRLPAHGRKIIFTQADRYLRHAGHHPAQFSARGQPSSKAPTQPPHRGTSPQLKTVEKVNDMPFEDYTKAVRFENLTTH